ncbi:MAG: IS30 family transposase [Filifactoraceae bacterium]
MDLRPKEVEDRTQFGHWEADTVIGKKRKNEAVVFSIVERLTGYYLCLRIAGKTTHAISNAMRYLHDDYGHCFSQVFNTITSDNGSEFASFSDTEGYGSQIYFAHPYSSWERPVNERTNRMLRRFIPKGTSINDYTHEQILSFADQINDMPRRRLGYPTPAELFDVYLDKIYKL